MERREIYALTEDDEKAVELFFRLGMPKHIAKTLIYISQVDECQSIDIEHGTYLRQPEVSIAMQELQSKGWIKKRAELKKEGKGRPTHIYKIATDFSDILVSLEHKKLEEYENAKKDISELKHFINRSP